MPPNWDDPSLNDPAQWTHGGPDDGDDDVHMGQINTEPDVLAVLDGHTDGAEADMVGEVYSPPRVVPIARQRGHLGGWSLDLTSHDAQGRPWDFDCEDTKQRARRLVRTTKPKLLILSPMCTYFSTIMNLGISRRGSLAPSSTCASPSS